MPIKLIETDDAFCALEDDWRRLYQADSEASIFLSWRWMHSLLMERVDQPIIIAWYENSSDSDNESAPRYGAFLPLRRQVRLSRSRGEFYNAYSFAGNYWADYTGVLCDPAVQDQALSELGTALSELGWRRLYLECVRDSPERLECLFKPIREHEDLRLELRSLTDNEGTTDLGKAPLIHLPNTFEDWLQNTLSANTRQKLRRFRRKLSEDETLYFALSTHDTHERNIAALQRFWRARWSGAKGRHVDTLAEKYAALVREGLEAGDMILLTLLHAGKPVALHACYVDSVRRDVSFFVGARDTTFSMLPPGLLLHAYAIEWAIEQQMLRYDLLRGDEAYKYSLGAVDQSVTSYQVTRKHLSVEHRFLDSECRVAALSALQAYQGDARVSRVHDLYSQLLESWPGDAVVLEQYALWLKDLGDHDEADEIARTLAAASMYRETSAAI